MTLGLSDSGGTGVWATGAQEGGYFADTDGSGQAWVARGDRGIEGTGSGAGGAFWTPNDASAANVATQTSGVEGWGPVQDAIFGDTDATSIAYVATGDSGINAIGDEMGGGSPRRTCNPRSTWPAVTPASTPSFRCQALGSWEVGTS